MRRRPAVPVRIALLTLGGLIADAAAARLVDRQSGAVALVVRSAAIRARGGLIAQTRRHGRRSGSAFLTYLAVAHLLGPHWPGGGGGASRDSLAAICARRGIPVVRCPDVNASDFHRTLCDHEVGLIVTACFDQILSPATVAAVPGGAVNIHPAPLPAYRGPCPLIDMAVDGVTSGAATLHRIEDAGIDRGAILAARAVDFPESASILARERLAYLAGTDLLAAVFDELPDLIAAARPQEPGSYRSFPDRQRLRALSRRGVPLWKWSDLADRNRG